MYNKQAMKKGTVSKTKTRVLRVLLPILILALLLGLGPNLLMLLRAGNAILTPETAGRDRGDCILVLGAGLKPDGSPNLMLAERIAMGVRLYETGAAPKLLMTGDHTRPDHDEVNAMKDAAMAAGVPSEDIFMDHAGINTYDSLYRAKVIFGAERLVIVTQAYHLPWALYIAGRLGMEAVGVPCDTRRYPGQFNRDVREILARDKDLFKCLILPRSTCLGEAIPLSGSGDVTNDRG